MGEADKVGDPDGASVVLAGRWGKPQNGKIL